MKKSPRIKINSPKLLRIPPLKPQDHKYSRGHALVLGGAVMTGAPRLSALAAQRAGAGMVTLAVPVQVWPVYAASMMSVIVRALQAPSDWGWVLTHRHIRAVLLGPGAEADELRKPLRNAIKSGLPLVLDAGALALIAEDKKIRELVAGSDAIYTPHDGEYLQLANSFKFPKSTDRAAKALQLAKALRGVVVLKGAETIIAAADGRVVRNISTTPWLATAGTGDVLADIITGLRAQGMDAFDAACAGVWLHGEAATHFGVGMIAEDLLLAIPAALQEAV